MSIGRDDHGANKLVRLSVYHRDRWTCQMPECLCPDGRAIDPGLRGTESPWAPSIDHVEEVARGGADEKWNMRAAHQRCNGADARDLGRNLTRAENAPVPIKNTIGGLFPELAELARKLES